VLRLKEKNQHIGFPTFKMLASTKHMVMTDSLNIIFDEFVI